MKIICDCGKEMTINVHEPDQDEIYQGFDCPKCGASFYGTWKPSEKDNGVQTLGDILRHAMNKL